MPSERHRNLERSINKFNVSLQRNVAARKETGEEEKEGMGRKKERRGSAGGKS